VARIALPTISRGVSYIPTKISTRICDPAFEIKLY